MEHTKGPWRYEVGTKTIRSVPANYWLASMDSFDGAVDHTANAHLIAAAPEMLEVLRRLIAYNDGLLQRSQFPPIELEPARAAIAKAEGHRE